MAKYLYIHVPFCAHICYYCDFVHQVYQKDTVDKWLRAIEYELINTKIDDDLKTIYVGGGTPTSLNDNQLDYLFKILEPYASNIEEYTIEINPETITENKAKILKKYHINRVSIGLQTVDESLLKIIGRRHKFHDIENCVKLLKKNGIDNISFDLMYSLPDQTMKSLQETVSKAISLEPTHLSLYSLTIEENTLFGKKGIKTLNEDIEADMYEWLCEELPKLGYEQYEISNFAKKGKQSIHNKAYWHYEDFIGVGCGASGKDGLIRYDHTKRINDYIENPLKKYEIHNSKEDAMFEMIMMNLRLKEGLSLNRFKQMWGININEYYKKTIDKLIKNKLIIEENGYLKTTQRGFEILNDVLEEFL